MSKNHRSVPNMKSTGQNANGNDVRTLPKPDYSRKPKKNTTTRPTTSTNEGITKPTPASNKRSTTRPSTMQVTVNKEASVTTDDPNVGNNSATVNTSSSSHTLAATDHQEVVQTRMAETRRIKKLLQNSQPLVLATRTVTLVPLTITVMLLQLLFLSIN